MSEKQSTPELRRVPLGRRLVWGAAAGLVFAAIACGLSFTTLFTTYEARTLDWRQIALAKPTPAVDQVAIVLIDDDAIERAEADDIYYPWPRDFYEPMIVFLERAGARAIVFDMIFSDPSKEKAIDEVFVKAAAASGKVVLGAKLANRPTRKDVKSTIDKARVPLDRWPFPARSTAQGLLAPFEELTPAARSVGCVNVVQDPDNTVRRGDLVYPYPDASSPIGSLALQAACLALGPDTEMRVEGSRLVHGERRVPLTADGRLLIRFYGKEQTFATENALALVESYQNQEEGKPPRVDPAKFKDRIVILGVNAAGIEDIVTVPVSGMFPGAEFHATVCANLIGGDYLVEPARGTRFAYLGIMGLAAGLVLFGFWEPLRATACAAVLAALTTGAGFGAFRLGHALDVFFPALVIGGAYVSALAAGYLTEGRQKREVARAFGQYLSPVVVRDLLQSPEALKLGGETRRIAVYFSDIAGFSTFSEKMKESELVSFLNVYLTAMTDVILEHRGVIDKYVGDLIMAFWGAPLPVDNPALEACLAVADQRRILADLNRRFGAEGRPPLDFRAGLNLGPAVVGNMGSSRRFDYTAMGDTVNLASRLEGANKSFGTNVLMTEAVRSEAGDRIASRRIGLVQVVGKGVPALIHELVGLKEDLDPAALERLGRYHDALERMEIGEPGAAREAAARFRSLLAESPDPLVEACLEKCAEIERGGSWNGVWILKSKG